MNHWLLMFRPDTFEVVKTRGLIGVLDVHRRRFSELQAGDRFVAYLSKRMVFDGWGELTSGPHADLEPIFPGRNLYPQRCRVAFHLVDRGLDAKELIWDLSLWPAERKTTPWNLLYCYGGFQKLPEADFVQLRDAMAAPR